MLINRGILMPKYAKRDTIEDFLQWDGTQESLEKLSSFFKGVYKVSTRDDKWIFFVSDNPVRNRCYELYTWIELYLPKMPYECFSTYTPEEFKHNYIKLDE